MNKLKHESSVEQNFHQCFTELATGDPANTGGDAAFYCATKAYDDAAGVARNSTATTAMTSNRLFAPLGAAARQVLGPSTFTPQHLLGPGGERAPVTTSGDCYGSGAMHLARQVIYGPGGASQTLNTSTVSGFGNGCRW